MTKDYRVNVYVGSVTTMGSGYRLYKSRCFKRIWLARLYAFFNSPPPIGSSRIWAEIREGV